MPRHHNTLSLSKRCPRKHLTSASMFSVIFLSLVLFPGRLIPEPAYGEPITSVAAEKASLGILLKQLQDSLNGLIDHAEYSANMTAFNAFQMVSQTLRDAERIYADSLQLTIDKLDPQIREAYFKMANLVDRLDEAIATNSNKWQEIGDEASRTASDLPFAEKEPRVFRYTPEVLVAQSTDGNVRMTLVGKNLNYGKAQLILTSHPSRQVIDCGENIGGRLKCEFSRSYVSSKSRSVNALPIRLIVNGQRPWYKPWIDPPVVDIPLLLYVLPDQAATYELAYSISDSRAEYSAENRVERPSVVSDSNTSDYKYECKQYFPRDGYKIDVNTLSHNPGEDTGEGGQVVGFQSVSSSGFCFKLGAKGLGWLKTRGYQNAVIRWREYKDITVTIPPCINQKVTSKPAVPLPDGRFASITNLLDAITITNLQRVLPEMTSSQVSAQRPDCTETMSGELLYTNDRTISLPGNTTRWELTIIGSDNRISKAIGTTKIPGVADVTYASNTILIHPILSLPNPSLQ